MSVKKDITKLLREAQRQGAEVRYCGSQHLRVSYHGRSTVVSNSPSDPMVLRYIKRDLRALGLHFE